MYQTVFQQHNYSPTLGQLFEAGVPIFNDWWNTHVPEYRQVLETKILHKYWFYQIGQETPDRFIHTLNQTLEEIMPYYNQLYASELIHINPMLNHAITTDHRSIENLIKDAQSSIDKYGKAVRDFLEKSGTSTTGNIAGTGNITGSIDKSGQSSYNKHGDEVNHAEHVVDATHNDTDNITYSDKKVTDTDTTHHETKDGTEKAVTEKGIENTGTVTQENSWTETTDDDATTKTDRTLNGTTTATTEQDYSDTPQRSLAASQQQVGGLRRDYLSNVTWTNSTTTNSETEGTTQTSADDMTVEHSGKNTTTNDLKESTDQTVDTTTNITTDGTGTEDTTVDTSGKKDETMEGTRNETGSNDGTKKWEEHGGETSSAHQTTTQTTGTTSKSTGTQNTESRSTTSDDRTEGTATKENQVKTTDLGESTTQQGFMNISSSQLLDAFRKTFLNVDASIMEDIKTCFITVF